MDLIMLGKISQTKRQIPYDVTYRENLNNRTKQKNKLIKTEINRFLLVICGGGAEMSEGL